MRSYNHLSYLLQQVHVHHFKEDEKDEQLLMGNSSTSKVAIKRKVVL